MTPRAPPAPPPPDPTTITIVVGPPSHPTLFSLPTSLLTQHSPPLATLITTTTHTHRAHTHHNADSQPYHPCKPPPLTLPHTTPYIFKRVAEWLRTATISPRDLAPRVRVTGDWTRVGCSVGGGDGFPSAGPRPYDGEVEWRALMRGVYGFGDAFGMDELCAFAMRALGMKAGVKREGRRVDGDGWVLVSGEEAREMERRGRVMKAGDGKGKQDLHGRIVVKGEDDDADRKQDQTSKPTLDADSNENNESTTGEDSNNNNESTTAEHINTNESTTGEDSNENNESTTGEDSNNNNDSTTAEHININESTTAEHINTNESTTAKHINTNNDTTTTKESTTANNKKPKPKPKPKPKRHRHSSEEASNLDGSDWTIIESQGPFNRLRNRQNQSDKSTSDTLNHQVQERIAQ